MKLRDIGCGKFATREGGIVKVVGVGADRKARYLPVQFMDGKGQDPTFDSSGVRKGETGIVEREDRDDWEPYTGPVSHD